jgi:hypothetical protein
VGGKLAFYKERFNVGTDYWTLMKTALKLPKGLPVERIEALVGRTREVRDNKDLYFNSAVRILKLHGVKMRDGKRYAVPETIFTNSPSALERIRKEVLENLPVRNQRPDGGTTEFIRSTRARQPGSLARQEGHN